MKEIKGNKAVIIGMAQRGELKEGEEVLSLVNGCKYHITKSSNHQGEWVGVIESV